MPKFFPVAQVRTIRVEVPVGDSGEVSRETLRYDLPEVVNRQTLADAIITAAAEQLGNLTEEVVAALLAKAEEELSALTEVVRVTVGGNALDAVPDVGQVQSIDIQSSEAVPVPLVVDQVELTTQETVPTPVEDVNIRVTATASEMLPDIVEDIAATIVSQDDFVPGQSDEIVINATLNGYANAVASNTGFTNPNNALGNTTNTAATLTATSSGLAGTTNNTTNGTLVLDFQDVNLGDLNITSVVLRVETQRANAGVAIVQPTSNVQFQYSFDGTNFTTFHTITAAQAKSIQQIDVTGLVGQNQSLLSALRIRATGSVTSGTGLGASNTVSFFRAWMEVLANRTYP